MSNFSHIFIPKNAEGVVCCLQEVWYLVYPRETDTGEEINVYCQLDSLSESSAREDAAEFLGCYTREIEVEYMDKEQETDDEFPLLIKTTNGWEVRALDNTTYLLPECDEYAAISSASELLNCEPTSIMVVD